MDKRVLGTVVTVSVVLARVAVVTPTAAQEGLGRPQWSVRINETRGPLRAADMKPLGKDAVSEVLAGPTNGSDHGYLIFTRMPASFHCSTIACTATSSHSGWGRQTISVSIPFG